MHVVRDTVRVELLGTPGVVLVTDPFKRLATSTATAVGLESLPITAIPHPQAGIPRDLLRTRIMAIVNHIVASLTRQTEEDQHEIKRSVTRPIPQVLHIRGRSNTDALQAVNDLFCENRWTDGFPVVPPTEEALQRMLAAVERDPEEVVGVLPPENGRATIRSIAINSVMAGATPSLLPVIVAAIEALVDPRFAVGEQDWGLHGMQITTGPVSPLIIVNGPLARELNIAAGYGCFSRGHRANATIGRAVRLILTNAGGSYTGINDMKGQGSSQEFAYCCAEQEDHRVYHQDSRPWEPLHVERGFPRDLSTVTVAAAWPPLSVCDAKNCGPEILDLAAATLCNLAVVPHTLDREVILVLGATHAGCLADAGMSKDDIREYVYANSVMSWQTYKKQYPGPGSLQPRWMRHINDDSATVHIYKEPRNFEVIVAGGDCPYSQVVRVSYKSVTKLIRAPKG